MPDKRWLPETLFDDLGFRMSYEVERVIHEAQTSHQHLVLFDHAFFGKMLMLDGATQVTSKDELWQLVTKRQPECTSEPESAILREKESFHV